MSTPNRQARRSKGATIDGKPAGGQFAKKGVPKLADDDSSLSFNDAADATLRSLEALGESMKRSDEHEERLLRRLDESVGSAANQNRDFLRGDRRTVTRPPTADPAGCGQYFVGCYRRSLRLRHDT